MKYWVYASILGIDVYTQYLELGKDLENKSVIT